MPKADANENVVKLIAIELLPDADLRRGNAKKVSLCMIGQKEMQLHTKGLATLTYSVVISLHIHKCKAS